MQRRPREAQQLFQINATTAIVDVKQATRKAHGLHKLQIVFRPTSEHGSAISSGDGRPCGAVHACGSRDGTGDCQLGRLGGH